LPFFGLPAAMFAIILGALSRFFTKLALVL